MKKNKKYLIINKKRESGLQLPDSRIIILLKGNVYNYAAPRITRLVSRAANPCFIEP